MASNLGDVPFIICFLLLLLFIRSCFSLYGSFRRYYKMWNTISEYLSAKILIWTVFHALNACTNKNNNNSTKKWVVWCHLCSGIWYVLWAYSVHVLLLTLSQFYDYLYCACGLSIMLHGLIKCVAYLSLLFFQIGI